VPSSVLAACDENGGGEGPAGAPSRRRRGRQIEASGRVPAIDDSGSMCGHLGVVSSAASVRSSFGEGPRGPDQAADGLFGQPAGLGPRLARTTPIADDGQPGPTRANIRKKGYVRAPGEQRLRRLVAQLEAVCRVAHQQAGKVMTPPRTPRPAPIWGPGVDDERVAVGRDQARTSSSQSPKTAAVRTRSAPAARAGSYRISSSACCGSAGGD